MPRKYFEIPTNFGEMPVSDFWPPKKTKTKTASDNPVIQFRILSRDVSKASLRWLCWEQIAVV